MDNRFLKCANWFKKEFPEAIIDEEATVHIVYGVNKPHNPQAPFDVSKIKKADCLFCGSSNCHAENEYACSIEYLVKKEVEDLFDKHEDWEL